MKRLSVLFTLLLVSVSFASGQIAEAGPPPAPPRQECLTVAITSPRQNAILRGSVEIMGSASIGDFQFYKVEYSTQFEPDRWIAVSTTYSQPVINGRLDVWNTTTVPDGTYNIKLTAVDIRGQEPCRVVIRQLVVANAAPTETPTPTATPPSTPTPRPPTPTIAIFQPTVEGEAGLAETPEAAPQATPRASGTPGGPVRPSSGIRTPAGLIDVSVKIDLAGLGQAFIIGVAGAAAVFIVLGFLSLVRHLLA